MADTLYTQGLNDDHTFAAQVNDTAPPIDMKVAVSSDYGYLDLGGGTDVSLPYMFCVDLQDQIKVPTNYDVTLVPVYDAAAWLYSNIEAATLAAGQTLTKFQDAGLQLAIWDVTYPGIVFSDVSFEGDSNKAKDPTYWEGVYLADDNYGALLADGTELLPTVGGNGQAMIIAPPPGGTNNLPGPLAGLTFLVGVSRRRKRLG